MASLPTLYPQTPHLEVPYEPGRPFEEAHALLGSVVCDGPVQLSVHVQVVERILALGAGGNLLVGSPLFRDGEDTVSRGRMHLRGDMYDGLMIQYCTWRSKHI